MKYTIAQAKLHFEQLLREVTEGKENVIVRGKTPIAKIVRIAEKPKARRPGALKGQISCNSNAFKPLARKELKVLGFVE
jgi:antitoxin (DNA-binding transcriptional repressor) of toxin-antitoxin stability system